MSSSSPPPRRSPSQPHGGQQWRRGQQVRKPTAWPNAGTSSEHSQLSAHRAVDWKGAQQPKQTVTVTEGAPAVAWGRTETGSSRGYANALVVPRGQNGETSASLSQQQSIASGGSRSPSGNASRALKAGSWGGVIGRGAELAQNGATVHPARQVGSYEERSPLAPTKAAAVSWPSLSTQSAAQVSPSRSRPRPQPSQKEPHANPPSPVSTVPASTTRAWEKTASRPSQTKPKPSPAQPQQQPRQPQSGQLQRADMPSHGGKEVTPGPSQPLQLLSRPQEKSPSERRPKEQSQQKYQLVKRKSNKKEKRDSDATTPVPSAGGNTGKALASSVVPSSKATSASNNAAAGVSKKPGQSSQHGNSKKPKPSSNGLTLSDLMPAGVKKGGNKNRSKGGGKDKRRAHHQQEETAVPAPVPAPALVPTEDDFPPMAPPPLRSYPPLADSATVNTRSSSPKKVRSLSSNDVANKSAAEAADGSKKGAKGVKHSTPNDKGMKGGLTNSGRQSAKDKVGEKGMNSASLLPSPDATKKKKKKKKQVTGSDLLATLPPAKMTADEEQMHLMRSMMLGMKKGAGTKANGQNDASSSFPVAAATKGKQRLGPRKKRLTTLKKKVLQERLRKWREKEEHEQKGMGAAVSTPLESESKVEAFSTVNDTAQSQQISSVGENGECSDEMNGPRKIVYLSNFVEPDELDDDEEYEEILGDVNEMAAKIGPVENVAVPRTSRSENLREEKKETSLLDDHVGLVVVTFKKELDAIAARDCWDGMVIGGTQVHASLSVPGRREEATEAGNDDVRDSPQKATLVLDNILGDDDFADDDCLEESKADIMEMCNGYGRIDQFRIELEDDCKGLVYIGYEEGEQVAILAANDLNGKVIGGQVISARVAQLGSSDSSGPAASHGAANKATVGAHVSKSTFIVALENILTEDDFVDEDCLQESKDDILELAREYGHVDEVYTEQDVSKRGCVYVRYHIGQEAADLAVTKLNGMVIGGQTVAAQLVGDIVLSNLLTADDFLDEECLEESKSDIMTLASKYGEVTAIRVANNAHYDDAAHEGLVYVSYREGEKAGNLAVEGLDGITIGGQQISAWSMHKNAEENVQTRASHVTANLANENNNASEQKKEERKAEAGGKSNPEESEENAPAPMYSGDKVIPERYAACKRVPKIPNAVPNRSYASRIDSDAAVPLLNEMLGELMRFQLRAKDDANARARRRLVMGLREVARGLRAHKVKMVIMANNLDEYGVIDNKLEEILDLAREWDVPVLFELNKRKLGKALGKTIKVSVVGIQNADGAHQQFKKLQKLASLPRKAPPEKSGE